MNVVGKALDELYRCFDLINEKYYEGKLKQPVITIQKQRSNNLGHFTLDKIWRDKEFLDDEDKSYYEININPINLNRPVEDIMETLNHEMVHYLNKTLEINDCSGAKHNKKFKEIAEKVGLICENDKKYGWGITYNSEEFLEFIHNIIKPNKDAFTYFMYIEHQEKEKKPREKKTFKHTCPVCGEIAKGKKDAIFICGKCNVEMEIEDDEI